ncbi:hypothetical protein QTL97_03885 [Sporosarcina thermotolerans]|uniref:Uncharacterized protein n=1 Tax=Sporosarcina thermotolerans TaxID=633404 RepID=A0AAW9A651_9BACL|nr:hypothetical protein [Sporosarcina thermotolerans]MDW0116063.1 hypothetical protein [Sporosarcina thermotolerans]WHT48034.1 hypothetical protein QNH10_18640 [Sporosarcina thermotolerans]
MAKKIVAIVLAVSVVAFSFAIYGGVKPAVELLASFEKQYVQHKSDVQLVKIEVGEDLIGQVKK